ncbi:MAG: DNA-processing protein DprA [Wujia sp.]
MMDEICEIYKYWFYSMIGLSTAAKNRLLDLYACEEEVYHANEEKMQGILTDKQLDYLVSCRNIERCRYELERMRNNNISYICICDDDYPSKLKNIYNPPSILYIKGHLNNSINIYNSSIAVVGSRRADVYGKEIAKAISGKLAASGINIVSGLARGIDSCAHRGALEAGGYTVGVLGCGINVIYPRENIELFQVMEEEGAIISEYGMDVPPMPENFPMRNRIISGLSDGVLVVEAAIKSGSLITTDFALEQGKQVYAVPGRIRDKNCEGTNNLIKQGAICVTEYEDIIRDMLGPRNLNNTEGVQLQLDFLGEINETAKDDIKNLLAPAEKLVYSCLSLEPMYIDDIISQTKLNISKTISVLYTLEEKKIIKQTLKGYYIICL